MGSSLARASSAINSGELISATFKPNRRTGAVTAKVVGDGVMEVVTVTESGVKFFTKYVMPTAKTAISKCAIAKDLHKNGIKGIDIADLIQVSSSTVSRWLKK